MYNNYDNFIMGSNTDHLMDYGHNEALYSSFIPHPSVHDQVQLGSDAYGHGIFLDTGAFF